MNRRFGRRISEPGSVLSPSQVATLMDCSYRWYGKYVLELPDPPTGNQALGKAVHAALAANFRQKCETEVDLPVAGAVALFREAWNLESEHTEFRDDEEPRELGRTGEILVAKYLEEAAPSVEPIAVELYLEGTINGVMVHGFLDVLDLSGCVIEIKTARAKPSNINPIHKFQIATLPPFVTSSDRNGPRRYARQDQITPTHPAVIFDYGTGIAGNRHPVSTGSGPDALRRLLSEPAVDDV